MIGCPTCNPSAIACRKHCPGWLRLLLAQKPKNPRMVALGRLGGRKGGKMRLGSMSPAKRRAFARSGGLARWKKRAKENRTR